MADGKVNSEAEAKVESDKAKLKNACPKCGKPWSFGLLGVGTTLEVQCANRMCKTRFPVIVV